MNRKAQAQIITTVLIILLVLVVIAIVWGVVGRFVKDKQTDIEETAACLDVELTIVSATAAVEDARSGSVVVRRDDNSDTETIKVLLYNGDGAKIAEGATELEVGDPVLSIDHLLTSGTVQVAAQIGDTICEKGAEVTLE